MNKKAFTLVELLATMAILAVISIIAVPNVIKIMAENKKEKVLNDGLAFIALAKQEVASDIDFRMSLSEIPQKKMLNNMDVNSDITLDPDGVNYNRNNSYVNISKESGEVLYCVYLTSDNWSLENTGNCVYESDLLSDNAKTYVKEN